MYSISATGEKKLKITYIIFSRLSFCVISSFNCSLTHPLKSSSLLAWANRSASCGFSVLKLTSFCLRFLSQSCYIDMLLAKSRLNRFKFALIRFLFIFLPVIPVHSLRLLNRFYSMCVHFFKAIVSKGRVKAGYSKRSVTVL